MACSIGTLFLILPAEEEFILNVHSIWQHMQVPWAISHTYRSARKPLGTAMHARVQQRIIAKVYIFMKQARLTYRSARKPLGTAMHARVQQRIFTKVYISMIMKQARLTQRGSWKPLCSAMHAQMQQRISAKALL